MYDTKYTSDEDDPIVDEIPVYLSKRLTDKLYVFQYPLRPKATKPEMDIRKASVKPNNKEVKLEMRLNINAANFDMVKAEYLAKDIDRTKRNNKDKETFFENDIVDKMVYKSTKAVSEKEIEKYAVGMFTGKEFHVTPLKGLLQLRPSLEHLNKSNMHRRDQLTDDVDDDLEVDEGAGPSNAEAVTVKFARNDGERGKMKENSYQKLKEKRDAEKWIECEWFGAKSTKSEILKTKLLAECMDDIGQAMNITAGEYIKVLVPDDKEEAIIKPSLPSNVLSLHALKALPLLEQCRLLLKDAKIIQFQELFMLLAGDGLTSDGLLKYLPQVAVLVRGNWIVKSEILYPQNTLSAVSGVPAEQMCKARDYVLYLFTQNQYVDRRKVTSIIRLPTEEVKEIFTGISRLRHNRGWELILPFDMDFMNKFNDIVLRQQLLWDQRAVQLSDMLKETTQTTSSTASGNAANKRQRRKSKSVSEDSVQVVRAKKDSISSESDSGTEKQKSPITARKFFKKSS